jgi:cyclic beta-1,2-glucan synthetase
MLSIDPVIPKEWHGFHLRYRHKNTWYEIDIENPAHVNRGVTLFEFDGVTTSSKTISLRDDKQSHTLRVRLGPESVPSFPRSRAQPPMH